MKLISILILSLFTFNGLNIDRSEAELIKPFEGTITYKIEYIKVPDEVVGMESMLPQKTVMAFKGDKVRLEQEVMGGEQIVISNALTGESHVLMNMMGQQIDIYISAEAATAEQENIKAPIIEDLPGEKTILGYKCKKAEVLSEGNEARQTVFYTKKINIKHNSFKTLNGFPLEFLTFENDMTLRMTAIDISERKIDDAMFEVPEGYERMTMAELTEMMGGN